MPRRNEEGEEHLQQRRQQLPFNLATGEGVLYDLSLDAFTLPAPTGTEGPPAESPLDPSSILGSLHRQDRSLYSQSPAPRLTDFSQVDESDPEQPLERAFSDSRALLSVPGQLEETSGSASHPMLDSLEQILGDLGDGGLDDLEVEQRELREWESTLLSMNQDRDLDRILANDVFAYVEEALGLKTAGGESSLQASPDCAWPSELGPEVLSGVLFSGAEPPPNSHLGHWPAGNAPFRHGIPSHSCRYETAWRPLTATSNTDLAGAHSNPSQQAAWPRPRTDATGPQFSNSCMYEHLANSGPGVPQEPPYMGLAHVSAPSAGFALPHAVGEARPPVAAAGQTQLPALGGMCETGASLPEHRAENGALQSTFFCWNGQVQVSKT